MENKMKIKKKTVNKWWVSDGPWELLGFLSQFHICTMGIWRYCEQNIFVIANAKNTPFALGAILLFQLIDFLVKNNMIEKYWNWNGVVCGEAGESLAQSASKN